MFSNFSIGGVLGAGEDEGEDAGAGAAVVDAVC